MKPKTTGLIYILTGKLRLYHKILEYKEENNYNSHVYRHSFDSNTLIPHGKISDVYSHYGLSDEDLLNLLKEKMFS